MTSSAPAKTNFWIRGPAFDLTFFSFGWLLVFAAFLIIDQFWWKSTGRFWAVSTVLFISCLHRHITFPLVYGDPEKFQLRKKAYIFLPILFLMITLITIFHVKPAAFEGQSAAASVQVNSGEQLRFRFFGKGKRETVDVKFTGQETDLKQAAQTLEAGLGGRMSVAVAGERLHLELKSRRDGDSFQIVNKPDSRDLAEQLGLSVKGIQRFATERPWFTLLAVAAGLWCLFHGVMQKVGILRIYSRKEGVGKPWIDKAILFSWFITLIFYLGSSQRIRNQARNLSPGSRFLNETLQPFFDFFPYLLVVGLLVSLALTVLFFSQEIKAKHYHWPKSLFLIANILLLASFGYNVLYGFVAFGFFHAVEYLAIVNVFSKRSYINKPKESSVMARVVRQQGLYFVLFILVSAAVFIPWFFISRATVQWYIVGSSFLHFIYDGWIWKVRDPKVGKALGIAYPSPIQGTV